MSRRSWKQWFLQITGLSRSVPQRRPTRRTMLLEALDARITPAVNAFFSAGVLTINGDSANNTIEVSRDAAGKLLVNGGTITVKGGTATVANAKLIQIYGGAGNDIISLNEVNGSLPRANLYGGAGHDALTGGSGNDQLFGDAGNDTLLGKGGIDLLFGGAGDDTLTGGAANDQVFGQAGNDRMIWNPGDASDLNEGAAGIDTVEVNGGNGSEAFTTTANGTRVRFDRTDPAPFFVDIGTSENLVLNANGGDDSFSASGNLATLLTLNVDGGTGNDTLSGGNGADRLSGGDGDDFIDGNQGNDAIFLGAGDDTFQWDPGEGSDIVEGQDGDDTMLFRGNDNAEKFDLSANGSRLRLTRDLGTVTMDVDGIEIVGLSALGGADTITLNDLTGTAVTAVNLDLFNTLGAGDGAADTIIVSGTAGDDGISVSGDASGVSIVGLPVLINITGAEAASDRLTINALVGDDAVDATGLAAGVIDLTLNGGDGDDDLVGSDGDDTLLGETGDDILVGGLGQDALDGGSGENVLFPD